MRIGSSTLVAIKKAVPNCRLRPGGLPHRRLRPELPRLLPALPRLPHRQKHHVLYTFPYFLILFLPIIIADEVICRIDQKVRGALRAADQRARPAHRHSLREVRADVQGGTFYSSPGLQGGNPARFIEEPNAKNICFDHRLSLVWTGWTTRRGWLRGCAPSSGCSRSTPSGSARCSSSRSPSPPGRTSSSTR